MLRCRSELLALWSLTLVGCLSDGRPWGKASAELTAAFAPEAARLDEQGLLITSHNYAVQLDDLRVGFAELALFVAGEPEDHAEHEAHCHGGNCHEEPEEAPAPEGVEAAVRAIDVVRQLDAAGKTIPIQPCDERDCDLPRGVVTRATLRLRSLAMSGRFFDRRPEGTRRIPDEGVAFAFDLPAAIGVVAPLEEWIDDGEPVRLNLKLTFVAPPSILDGIETPDAGVGEASLTELEQASLLEAVVTRGRP
jgi:hypothetical protein